MPVDGIGFDSGWLHIANQVKVTKHGLVFAPPKRNKIRAVPLPDRVAHVLKQHMEAFPPQRESQIVVAEAVAQGDLHRAGGRPESRF